MTLSMTEMTALMHRFWAAETAYVAAGRQDFSPIAALLHHDCVMHAPESFPYGGIWRGHEQFERWTQGFADYWSRLEVTDPHLYQGGPDMLFIRSHARGTIRATGVDVAWPLLQQVRFEAGRIAEIWPFYWDVAAILGAKATPDTGETVPA